MNNWTMQRMLMEARAMDDRALAQRHALLAEAAHVRRAKSRRGSGVVDVRVGPKASQRSATGLPAGGRAVRRPRPVSQRLGTWLINTGTRLGGASIRTS